MSEFKVIETQEELDRIIGEHLARQKDKYADYDEIKQRVSVLEAENADLKTSLEAHNQTAADYEKQIESYKSKVSGYETDKMKMTMALKYGLPMEFADRLQGEDEDSLNADAQRFAEYMKPQAPTPPLKNVEPLELNGKDAAWRQVVKDLNEKGE